MKNNKLIIYKENIFTKILNFFKKKKYISIPIQEKLIDNDIKKEEFIKNIVIKENEEEKRLKALKMQYDNGEIDEYDISDENMDKLIEMYEKETKELNEDTNRRKIHIAQMLKD